MKKPALICIALSVFAVSAFASVSISSPGNGSTVGTSVHFVASAGSSCSKGVASMGIYPQAYQLAYTGTGASLDTSLNFNVGTYNVVIVEWDYCGGASTSGVTINVKSGGSSGVYITAPVNNSTVGSPANFSATATTACAAGVASMGIYTGPNQLAYVGKGASLNTALSLSAGTYNATVVEWDNCGGAATAPLNFTVASSGTTMWNLHSSGGWNGYAQQPPDYGDCNGCTPSGPGTTWALHQGNRSTTLSGNSTQFNLGGTWVYTDVLWNNHLIGDLSSQGMPDSSHTLVNTLHSFTYDIYFYSSNVSNAEALEFDINQFFDGMGFSYSHECRIMGGGEWDVWDNVNHRWVPTGIPCKPVLNSWNHVILQVERTSNNLLLYKSITMNGTSYTLNWTFPPFSAPGWWGVTVNYQMDGNYRQAPYTVYVDKLNLTYQ